MVNLINGSNGCLIDLNLDACYNKGFHKILVKIIG